MSWTSFEHQIWKIFKKNGLDQRESYLLAVSGGLDSMVLWHLLRRLKPQTLFRVVHFHHGESEDVQQKQFRDLAVSVVEHNYSRELKLGLKVELHLGRSQKALKSENDFREERWKFIRKLKQPHEIILTAHHQDDWFETVLLKMIRGASNEGLAQFKDWNQQIFRPFIMTRKSELQNYAKGNSIEYAEDPSNMSEKYLRNWLRENWLFELEKKVPGAYEHLSRSLLDLILQLQNEADFTLCFYKNEIKLGLDRSWYLSLSADQQLKALAAYLKKLEIREFTRGQLLEIQKRLDKNQKELIFEVLQRKWVINATQIMLE